MDKDFLLDIVLFSDSESSDRIDSPSENQRTAIFYSSSWFSEVEQYSELQFHETFRMNKSCFMQMVGLVSQFRSLLNVKEKCYVFLYYISNASTYRVLRNVMGIPRSTICRIVNEMAAVFSALAHRDIRLPNYDELVELEESLYYGGGRRETVLAIDGTHVYVDKPLHNGWNYYNRYGSFSISFMCLVDYKKKSTGCHSIMGVYRVSNFPRFVNALPHEFFIIGDPTFNNMRNVVNTYSTIRNPLRPRNQETLEFSELSLKTPLGFSKENLTAFQLH